MGCTQGSIISDLVVMEVGTRPSVAACGSLLRDLGAQVVVFESSMDGEDERRATRVAGKLSVVAGAHEGVTYDGMLAAADLVLLSSDVDGPGPRRRPGQIRCDITAFGGSGPLAGVPASEALVQAWSGNASVTGRAGGPPLITPVPLLEMEAAVYAAAAVMAALRVRDKHRVGQDIEIALYDVGVNALAAFLPLPLAGREATRSGNRHPILSPWNTYPTLDGWVMICAPTNDQWCRLCSTMDVPELGVAPEYATTSARLDRLDEVDALIADWTSSRTLGDCLSRLAEAGIASGPIVELGDLEHEPNLVHRSMLRRVLDPVSGRDVVLPGSPVRPGHPPHLQVPSPGAGSERVAALVARRRSPASEPAIGGFPLTGVRVIEIGMNTVAPLAGRQLGALGADVIKVEPPRGDVNRLNAPMRADGEAFIFSVSNTDKRGVVLDLRSPGDSETLWQLLSTADILIENLKPGSLDRLGFSAPEVLGRFPDLIYCSMTGFGHDSAYPGRPALDSVIQAVSGLMAATPQDGMPTKAGISIADQLGGQVGLLAVLAALLERDAGAGGVHLDLAMQDVTTWATHPLWNAPPANTPWVLDGSDGAVVVDGLAPEVVATRLGVAGNDALSSAARALTRHELLGRLDIDAVPNAAPVLSVAEVLVAEQTTARDLVVRRPTADGDTWTVLESPLRLMRTPARVRMAMSRLGVMDLALRDEIDKMRIDSGMPEVAQDDAIRERVS